MKEKWEAFRVTLADTEEMSKKEFLLTIAVCILGGIVVGMLFSPRKSTMIGSCNGNNADEKDRKDGKKKSKDKKGKTEDHGSEDDILEWED